MNTINLTPPFIKAYADSVSMDNELRVDFNLFPYLPPPTTLPRLDSKALLVKTIENHPQGEKFLLLIKRLQEASGKNNLAWSYKTNFKEHWWEFYTGILTKSYQSNNLLKKIQGTLEGVVTLCPDRTLTTETIGFGFTLHPDSFSIHREQPIYAYIPNHVDIDKVYTGISYKLFKGEIERENHYHWYRTNNNDDMQLLQHKINISPYFEKGKKNLLRVLKPELMSCEKVWFAKKPKTDGLYFNKVNIEQFYWFIDQFNLDPSLLPYIQDKKDLLKHLQLDVGFDYRFVNGKIEITKCGIYSGL